MLPIDSIDAAGRGARRARSMDRLRMTLDWEPVRAARRSTRHAQLQRDGDRADRDDLQHLRRRAVDRAALPATSTSRSNLSGDFTVVNELLVRDLKARGLWDEVMVDDLKYFDGSVGPIDRIPDDLKALYATAFEIDRAWLIEAAARRQKWIDQAQSLNLYIAEPSGKKLDALYRLAWRRAEDDLLPALARRDAGREIDAATSTAAASSRRWMRARSAVGRDCDRARCGAPRPAGSRVPRAAAICDACQYERRERPSTPSPRHDECHAAARGASAHSVLCDAVSAETSTKFGPASRRTRGPGRIHHEAATVDHHGIGALRDRATGARAQRRARTTKRLINCAARSTSTS